MTTIRITGCKIVYHLPTYKVLGSIGLTSRSLISAFCDLKHELECSKREESKLVLVMVGAKRSPSASSCNEYNLPNLPREQPVVALC